MEEEEKEREKSKFCLTPVQRKAILGNSPTGSRSRLNLFSRKYCNIKPSCR